MNSRRALLVTITIILPLFITTFAVLNPLVLYSYDGRACSRADLYLGPLKIGSLELKSRDIPSCSPLIIPRIHCAPLTILKDPIPMVGIRCIVNKTLEEPMPGAPEDTLGVGLIVMLPDGSKSTLLCFAAQSDYASRRTSKALGEIYECSSTRAWCQLPSFKKGNVSVTFSEEDFFPALLMMVRDREGSLLDLEVIGVYALSEMVIFNEGGRYVEASRSGILRVLGGYPSHVIIDGNVFTLNHGLARVDPMKGICTVEFLSLPFQLGTFKIQLSIEL